MLKYVFKNILKLKKQIKTITVSYTHLRTRVLAIVISTVLAGFGQIIYLQNIGTMNTYNSHEQIGMFSIAALLIGGASAVKASIPNAITGIIL